MIDTGGWGVNGPAEIINPYISLLGLGPNPDNFDCILAKSFPSKFSLSSYLILIFCYLSFSDNFLILSYT